MDVSDAKTESDPITPSTTKDRNYLNSKSIAFVSIISALGAILSISTFAIPLGPNLALDLSHIGTYLVSIGGGPILGTIAGALVGIIPSMSPNIQNAALIPGKMLTGFSVGFLYLLLKRVPAFQKNSKLQFMPILIAGIVGYIPELLFTVWDLYFVAFTFMAEEIRIATISGIMIKAWIEIIVISILTSLIYSVRAIREEVDHLVGKAASLSAIEYIVSGIIVVLSMLLVIAISFGNITRAQDAFLITTWVLVATLGALIVSLFVKKKR